MAGLLLTTFAVHSLALPGTADARCNGQGVLVNSRLIVNGITYVTDRPVAGTCNGNDTYTADVRSHISGRSALVFFRQSTADTPLPVGPGGTSWYRYELHDLDENSRMLMTLCIYNSSTTICGWGENWRSSDYPSWDLTYYGVNSGF